MHVMPLSQVAVGLNGWPRRV